MVGGITLCQLTDGGRNHSLSADYLYNGQLPHRSQDDLGVQDSGNSDPQDEKEVSSCRYELPTSRASGAEALQNAAHCQTRSPDTWSDLSPPDRKGNTEL